MTAQYFIVSLAAAVASFLLFLAGLSSPALALPFVFLTPLPIMIVGFGWGTRVATVAAITASVGLFTIAGPQVAAGFALFFMAPAAYATHMIGLSRTDNGVEEWYPLGDVLFRLTLYGGTAIGVALMATGFNAETAAQLFQERLEDFAPEGEALPADQIEMVVNSYVTLIPYVTPAFWLLMIVTNVWLAVRIAKVSNRFARPSARLRDAELPMVALPILAVSLIAALAIEPLQIIGATTFGAFAIALTLIGFNTIHVITTGAQMRGLILGSLYAATILISLPVLIMFALGITDMFMKIRQRANAANPT